MEFSELLKSYMKELQVTAKDLAEACELSPSVISRYRSGERLPAPDSPQVDAIARALGKKAKQLEHPTLSKKTIRAAFADSLAPKDLYAADLANRLSSLMDTLQITQAAMARGCGVDPSLLSRIRKGQRRPANPEEFVATAAAFISSNYTTSDAIEKLEALLGQKTTDKDALVAYLSSGEPIVVNTTPKAPSKSVKVTTTKAASKEPAVLTEEEQAIEQFFGYADAFHLQQYLRRLAKDQKPQSMMSKLAKRMTTGYKTLSEVRSGIADFLESIENEPIPGPLYWEDDITGGLSAMTSEERRRVIAALIHALQKNHSLCVAQPITAAFPEVLKELEQWLPLYMVGNMRSYRVTPGKKEDYRNLSIFTEDHILYGTSVSTKSNEALAYRKDGATEISYAMEQFQKLIRDGQPLVNVYRKGQRLDYHRYLMEYLEADGNTYIYHNTLPLETMEPELLQSILEQNKVDEATTERILNYRNYLRKQADAAGKGSKYTVSYPVIDKDQFATHPLTLDVSGLFLGAAIFYNYEEYEQHLASTRAYAKEHTGYKCVELPHIPFAHLSILSKKGQPAILCKDASPAAQLVISDSLITKVVESYLKKLQ
ncbi:MAG: transcriptional regulator [Lachnospiraceae bacterium]|nr:transcriptional regulator [Lachnospiraceae bacterium]